MKKKRTCHQSFDEKGDGKLFEKRKVLMLFVAVFVFMAFTEVSAQVVKLNFKNTPLREVFKDLKRQTGFIFVYNEEELSRETKVTLVKEKIELEHALREILKGLPYTFDILEGTVVIKPRSENHLNKELVVLKGVVQDVKKNPLPGVTVMMKGTTIGVVTDTAGKFKITLPKKEGTILVFTFIGMKKQEIRITNQQELQATLEEDVQTLNDVVVTGFFARKKESFTGSASTFTGNELKKVGNTSVLQSLSTLDPAFNLIRDNVWGSDPNRIPDMEIRGTTSFEGLRDEYGVNPNVPLFILDGFETDVETVMRLDMNRIASLTILKDAASTAIYGSRASNGVVVIETILPVMGKLFVNYNCDFRVEMPDLSDYNMMNAAEKLQFEVLAKRYESYDAERQMFLQEQYNARLRNVKEGVDTYWLSEPLRTGIVNGHSVNVSGGDQVVRYSLGLNYRNTTGVMKNSDRTDYGGDLFLSYATNKLKFSNRLYINYAEGKNPTVAFSVFVNANPYFKKRNSAGEVEKYLDQAINQDGFLEQITNPLWDYELNSKDEFTNFNFRNNFILEWNLFEYLKVRGRFSIFKRYDDTDVFYPAKHSKFDYLVDENKKGSYEVSRVKETSYEADFSLTFGKSWKAHLLNAYASWSVYNSRYISESWEVIGFPSDEMDHPLFSKGFPDNSKPWGAERTTRRIGAVLNLNYSYANRYLLDFSYRLDGASNFGSKQRYINSWSVGVAWNVHNEGFLEDSEMVNQLKLRGSVGTPSSQSFNSYQSYTLFDYDVETQSMFGLATLIKQLGNENLDWQSTLDMNVGLDITLFANHLFLTADFSRQITKNMIVPIDIPSSTGFVSYLTNLGKKQTDGYAFTLQGFLLKRQHMQLGVNVTGSHYTGKYKDISERLETLNEKNKSKNLIRYREGESTTALWAVKSAGIDPTTGQEVFYQKNGKTSFVYDSGNEVKVGDSNPDLRGVMGVNFRYKGFSLAFNLRYSFGGDVVNSTLLEKVENVDVRLNQDKRALYDRWQKPGDEKQFKAISLTNSTAISSRFIQKENFISGESVHVGYEFTEGAFLEKIGFSRIAVGCYMNDIFRLSTIKTERGISYPFARNLSFNVNLSF